MGIVGYDNPPVGADGVIARDKFRSDNYLTNVSGWAIFRAGSAEFLNAIMRGTVQVGGAGQPHILIDHGALSAFINLFSAAGPEANPGQLQVFIQNVGQVNEELRVLVGAPATNIVGRSDAAQIVLTSQAEDGSAGARVLVTSAGSGLANLMVADITNNRVDVNGVLASGNTISGKVTITPSAANTPTSAAVVFPTALKGTNFFAQVTANTTAPGTVVTGVSFTALTSAGITIWLTRTNLVATDINYFVRGV